MQTTDKQPFISCDVERAIRYEVAIRWVNGAHPEALEYAREGAFFMNSRQGKPRAGMIPGLVAFAVLSPDALADFPGEFLRRAWWLTSNDPYEGSGSPVEGVDPLSIRAGQLSILSDR